MVAQKGKYRGLVPSLVGEIYPYPHLPRENTSGKSHPPSSICSPFLFETGLKKDSTLKKNHTCKHNEIRLYQALGEKRAGNSVLCMFIPRIYKTNNFWNHGSEAVCLHSWKVTSSYTSSSWLSESHILFLDNNTVSVRRTEDNTQLGNWDICPESGRCRLMPLGKNEIWSRVYHILNKCFS